MSTGHKTKIQNFHSEENFQAYFGNGGYFLNKGKYLFYRIDNSKFDIDKKELMEAVAFEFGIKYFDRVFDELKQKALDIFSEKYEQYFNRN